MWTYEQKSGAFKYNNAVLCTGYSGYDDGDNVAEPGEGKNDPTKQGVRNIGPLPVGKYMIRAAIDHPHLGPVAMRLIPFEENNMLGRSGFFIHADSVKAPGTASQGCIILPWAIRVLINTSSDRELDVVAG